MGTAATNAKRKYNSQHYKEWRSPIAIELFEELETIRAKAGMSRSQFLVWAVEQWNKEK